MKALCAWSKAKVSAAKASPIDESLPQSRGRVLMQRLKALQVPPLPRRRLADPENLRLGGFIYCNSDNPAVVVDGGPLHMAVNVLNKVTYVYVIYWAGWVMLVSMAARAW